MTHTKDEIIYQITLECRTETLEATLARDWLIKATEQDSPAGATVSIGEWLEIKWVWSRKRNHDTFPQLLDSVVNWLWNANSTFNKEGIIPQKLSCVIIWDQMVSCTFRISQATTQLLRTMGMTLILRAKQDADWPEHFRATRSRSSWSSAAVIITSSTMDTEAISDILDRDPVCFVSKNGNVSVTNSWFDIKSSRLLKGDLAERLLHLLENEKENLQQLNKHCELQLDTALFMREQDRTANAIVVNPKMLKMMETLGFNNGIDASCYFPF